MADPQETRMAITKLLSDALPKEAGMGPDEMVSDWALIVHTSSLTNRSLSDYYTLTMVGNTPPHIVAGLFQMGEHLAYEQEEDDDG